MLLPFLLSLLLLLLLLLAVSPRVRSLGSRRRQGSPSPPPPTPRSNCRRRRRRCRRSARGRRRRRAPAADTASPGPRGRIAWAGPPENHSHLQSPAKLPPSSSWRNTFLGGALAFASSPPAPRSLHPGAVAPGLARAGEEEEEARTHGGRGRGVRLCPPAPLGLLGSGACSFLLSPVPTFRLFLSVSTGKSQNADA